MILEIATLISQTFDWVRVCWELGCIIWLLESHVILEDIVLVYQ